MAVVVKACGAAEVQVGTTDEQSPLVEHELVQAPEVLGTETQELLWQAL